MTKIFTRRKNIERATMFKVQYNLPLSEPDTIQEREFRSLKSMSQWIVRNDNDETLDFLVWSTQALIDDAWELFTTIGKKTVTLSELRDIIRRMEEDFKSSESQK